MKKVLKGLFIILFTLFISLSKIPNLLAASATISVSSSSSRVVVGKTFSVYIKVSSSRALGTWNFTPSYDKSVLKLVKGSSPVVAFGDGSVKSKTYTYTFKAIKSGSSKVSVKTYEVLDYKTTGRMSVSVRSKTISVITQSQLEASYSKNNNLKKLSIDNLKLSPSFNSKTTKYTARANANTTSINIKASVADSKSRVSGTGKKKVSEGENKFNIVVTAQNGSTKTYTVIVNVVDPNPIEVVLNDIKYTIVKRQSSLDKVEDYTNKMIKINNQDVPTLYNKENNITLVGLKNTDGDIKLFIYNQEDNSYKEYKDITLSKVRILPLDIDKQIKDYKNETIEIDEVKVEALNVNNHIYIIKARNFDTIEDNYYYYDKDNNTLIQYYENEEKPTIINDDVDQYKKIIMVLGMETIVIIFILICILISKVRKNKRKREYLKRKIEEEKQRQEEVQKLKEEIQELESKNKSSKSKTKKKEVSKNESKKKK